jgi:hypothetical protein
MLARRSPRRFRPSFDAMEYRIAPACIAVPCPDMAGSAVYVPRTGTGSFLDTELGSVAPVRVVAPTETEVG